jgi:hypothetical protein
MVGGMLMVDGEFRWNDKFQLRKPGKAKCDINSNKEARKG